VIPVTTSFAESMVCITSSLESTKATFIVPQFVLGLGWSISHSRVTMSMEQT
jgi:hypothetical protein